jgi:HK97 gp10 family phage protein
MSSTSVKLEGFEEFQSRLKKNVKLEDVKVVVQYHGSQMEQTAKIICPNRKGHLQASIRLDIVNNGFTAEVAPHMNYAGYVEWGTRYMASQPYIRPAFMQESARFKADLAKLMK